MTVNPVAINLAVEDSVSEAVVRSLLSQSDQDFAIGTCYARHGFGYLRRTIAGFNNACRGTPFLVLTDLDLAECPPSLISQWLQVPPHRNLIFRVAVREVEAWLLADRRSFAQFAGVRESIVPQDVEALVDPKHTLIEIVRRSRNRSLRLDIVPPANSVRKQGPNYSARMVRFALEKWQANVAAGNSESLRRAMNAVSSFVPRFH